MEMARLKAAEKMIRWKPKTSDERRLKYRVVWN